MTYTLGHRPQGNEVKLCGTGVQPSVEVMVRGELGQQDGSYVLLGGGEKEGSENSFCMV